MIKVKQHSKLAHDVYVTQEGLQDAKNELQFLLTTKRAQIIDRIQKARDFGDVSENSEYDAALDEQVLVENRILYLEEVLKDAKIIPGNSKNELVVIGSTVKVEMDGEIDEFTIVGKVEANPAKKKISNESPVGAAILGARVGEAVEVATPIVRYQCKILQIK